MDADKLGHYAAILLTLTLAVSGIIMLFMHVDRGMELIALAVPSSGIAARNTGKKETE
jgi:cytochrome b subunit of formate dehydrogenase